MTHTLEHALDPEASGCTCDMKNICACVVCGKALRPDRTQVDTCGAVCFRRLLRLQRQGAEQQKSPL